MRRVTSRPERPVDDTDRLQAAWDSLLYTIGNPPQPADKLADPQVQGRPPVPVIVLSGFLGAGKTTLLCELVSTSPAKLLAIVNDVASINVDAALVRACDTETIELENGCACCVLGNDLAATLGDIAARNDLPDAVVIEASGLADPMGIAQSVANHRSMMLDSIVTLVDGSTFSLRCQDRVAAPLRERQLAAAHLIVVTKTAGEGFAALRAQLADIAPGRPILRAEELAGRGAQIILDGVALGARPPPAKSRHNYERFAVEVITSRAGADASAFFALLDVLPDSVYRMKGWVVLAGDAGPETVAIQAAGPRWRVTAEQVGETNRALVVIGRAGDPAFASFCGNLERCLRGPLHART